jgi:hypothetical protein
MKELCKLPELPGANVLNGDSVSGFPYLTCRKRCDVRLFGITRQTSIGMTDSYPFSVAENKLNERRLLN